MANAVTATCPRCGVPRTGTKFCTSCGLEFDTGPWRDGGRLVARLGSDLPDRCVSCNESAEGRRLKRKLQWYPAWAFFLGGVLIAAMVSKRTTLTIGLCPRHIERRRTWIRIGFASLISAIVLPFLPITDYRLLASVVLIFVAVAAYFATRLLRATRMDEAHVWVKGVCRPYLDSLPAFAR